MKMRAPTRLEISLAASAVLLFLLLLEALLVKRGSLFPFAYAWFGFSLTVVCIAAARHLKTLLKRPKDYYPAEDRNG